MICAAASSCSNLSFAKCLSLLICNLSSLLYSYAFDFGIPLFTINSMSWASTPAWLSLPSQASINK